MLSLESKLPGVGTTIFTVMSRLAEDCGAINLSQGFPDFQPPGELLELVSHHLKAGRNQYPPMIGVASPRGQIAGKLAGLYGVQTDPDTEITVTSGATEALFCAIHAIVRAGDEVIVFDPAYDSYDPAIRLAGHPLLLRQGVRDADRSGGAAVEPLSLAPGKANKTAGNQTVLETIDACQ